MSIEAADTAPEVKKPSNETREELDNASLGDFISSMREQAEKFSSLELDDLAVDKFTKGFAVLQARLEAIGSDYDEQLRPLHEKGERLMEKIKNFTFLVDLLGHDEFVESSSFTFDYKGSEIKLEVDDQFAMRKLEVPGPDNIFDITLDKPYSPEHFPVLHDNCAAVRENLRKFLCLTQKRGWIIGRHGTRPCAVLMRRASVWGTVMITPSWLRPS